MADKDYVKGKFSKYETDIVLEMVTDYMEKKNVSIEEMCSAYRTTSKRQNHPFFKEIYSMLPHRSPKSVYNLIYRSLSNPMRDGRLFTPEEKEQLRALVKIHGNQIAKIARIMGKVKDETRQALVMLDGRKVIGKYSEEEDQAFLGLIRQLHHLPADTPIVDFPREGISWTCIANKLGNVRYPIDYTRHYQKLLVSARYRKSLKRYIGVKQNWTRHCTKLLQFLYDNEVNDETEVIWARIDRDIDFPRRNALTTWRILAKSCPPVNEDGDSLTEFSDKVEYLLRKCKSKVNDNDDVSGAPQNSSTASGITKENTGKTTPSSKRRSKTVNKKSTHKKATHKATLYISSDEEEEEEDSNNEQANDNRKSTSSHKSQYHNSSAVVNGSTSSTKKRMLDTAVEEEDADGESSSQLLDNDSPSQQNEKENRKKHKKQKKTVDELSSDSLVDTTHQRHILNYADTTDTNEVKKKAHKKHKKQKKSSKLDDEPLIDAANSLNYGDENEVNGNIKRNKEHKKHKKHKKALESDDQNNEPLLDITNRRYMSNHEENELNSDKGSKKEHKKKHKKHKKSSHYDDLSASHAQKIH